MSIIPRLDEYKADERKQLFKENLLTASMMPNYLALYKKCKDKPELLHAASKAQKYLSATTMVHAMTWTFPFPTNQINFFNDIKSQLTENQAHKKAVLFQGLRTVFEDQCTAIVKAMPPGTAKTAAAVKLQKIKEDLLDGKFDESLKMDKKKNFTPVGSVKHGPLVVLLVFVTTPTIRTFFL